MLTRRGWLCLWGGVLLLASARLLGLGELYVLGAVALSLLTAAAVYVRSARLHVHVDREVHPSRVHAGQPSRARIRVRNLRSGDTPVLRLHDAVSGTAGVDLLVAPLGHGDVSVASYSLPTDRRGVVRVGPLRVAVGDPFGLVQASIEAAPPVDVTVLPRVHEIQPVPFTTGRDPLAGALHPLALGRGGDDFYALRAYVVGDDPRRIHWPSTARHDELLVRQQEQPWQGRTTVIVDVRRAAHDGSSMELAVSVAASIVTANSARRDLVRLATTDGADSGYGSGSSHLAALLEHLAVVQPTGAASLRGMLDAIQRDGQGALVLVVGDTTEDELATTARLRQRFGLVIVVRVGGRAGAGGDGGQALAAATLVGVAGDDAFAPAWNLAMAAARSRPVTAGSRP